MNAIAFKNAIVKVTSKVALKAKLHAPEILMTAGGIFIAGGVGFTVYGTLKCQKALTKRKELMAQCEETPIGIECEDGSTYTVEDKKKDQFKITAMAVIDIAKAYAPAALATGTGIVCMLCANNILRKRASAAMAALTAVTESFDAYRKRVAEKYGAEEEYKIRYNVKEVIEQKDILDENGNKVGEEYEKTEVIDPDGTGNVYSPYHGIFDLKSAYYKNNRFMNRDFCKQIEEHATDRLNMVGFITLADVKKWLDIPVTPVDLIAGWANTSGGYSDGLSDTYVKIFAFPYEPKSDIPGWSMDHEGDLVLDFNCIPDIRKYMN